MLWAQDKVLAEIKDLLDKKVTKVKIIQTISVSVENGVVVSDRKAGWYKLRWLARTNAQCIDT